DEVQAAEEVHLVVTLLQGAHTLCDVTGEDVRALPRERLVERPARNVFGNPIEQAREWDRFGSDRPVIGEDLVRLSAHEEGIHSGRHFEDDAVVLGALERRLPAAIREPVLAIFVGSAGRLPHAVEGHEFGDDECAQPGLLRRSSLLLTRIGAANHRIRAGPFAGEAIRLTKGAARSAGY